MKILSIGNSFSQDAVRYLSRIAKSEGVGIKTVNLFIAGCSLKMHYYNMLEDLKNYILEYNGDSVGIKVTIKDALMSDDWDYITLQQVSRWSCDYDETYQPYLNALAEYVRKYCPHTKILIHQTWAYEEGSSGLLNVLKYKRTADMLEDIKKSYQRAKDDIKADGIIRSGELLYKLTQNGIDKVHRDTFHASLGVGRYALALLWYGYLTGNNTDQIDFKDFDEEVTNSEIEIVKKTIKEILN